MKFNYPPLAVKVIVSLFKGRRGERKGGVLRRSKRRLHLPRIRTFLLDRQTERQKFWFIGKLHFQKRGKLSLFSFAV